LDGAETTARATRCSRATESSLITKAPAWRNFCHEKDNKSHRRDPGGKQDALLLGNLEARRDWGYAPEYVEAIWENVAVRFCRHIVIGTGEAHSVREFLEEAFAYASLDWQKYVKSSARYMRAS